MENTIDQIENNKLIAEFDGWEFGRYQNLPNRCHKGTMNVDEVGRDLELLKYHSSWDWLMPVVEKIFAFKFKDGVNSGFRTFGMMNYENEFMVRFERCSLFSSMSLIDATYKAVIDFIKWYNSNIKE